MGKIRSWVVWFLSCSATLAVILVFFVWLLFMPKGNVSAYVDTLNDTVRDQAKQAFTDAQPIAFEMIGDWAFVAEVLGNPDAAAIQIADQRYKDSATVADALQIEFSFVEEAGSWKTDIQFLATPIFEQLYAVAGAVDYDFVFFGFQTDGALYTADVQLRPGGAGRSRLPAAGMSDMVALSRAIAEYIVTTAASREGSWFDALRDCEAAICPGGIPKNSQSLRATRDGLRLIYLGAVSDECAGNLSVQCSLRNAKEAFTMAKKADDTNDIARLGLGLASLKLARRLLNDGASEYEVAEEFDQAIIHLVQAAKQDVGIKQMIESKDFGNLLTTDEIAALDLSLEFVETAHHYLEAKTGLKPANYSKVIEELGMIKKPPRYLNGHIDSIRLTAELFQAKDIYEAEPYLQAMGGPEMKKAMRPWLYHYNYGYFLCYWSAGNLDRITEAGEHLAEARKNMPENERSKIQMETAEAYCAALTERPDLARAKLDTYFNPTIEDLMEKRSSGQLEGDDQMLLSFALLAKAEILVALQDHAKARELMKDVLEVDPSWRSFVQRSPIFADYRAAVPQ